MNGIFKEKNGTYTVQRQYKLRLIKKRGFQTLTDAKSFLAHEIYSIDHPQEVSIKINATLEELYAAYMDYRQVSVRITTLNGDKQKYNAHISPELGCISINELTPDILSTWKVNLVKKDMSELFTNQIIGVLKGILNYGLTHNYAIEQACMNELGRVKIKRIPNEREILTYAEIDRFLDTFRKDDPIELDYYQYFYALSRSGMRPNEFRGLQVKNLHFDYINVNHDITSKVSGQGDILQHCKNDYSVRDVLMPNDIMIMLRNRTKGYRPNDFIFGKEKAFRETNIKRQLDKHLELAGLRHITIYGFRHSHATHLIRNGVMVKVVSSRLGHKDIQTTLNTYQHLFKEDQQSVLKLL